MLIDQTGHTIEDTIHKCHVESQELDDGLLSKKLEWTSQRSPKNVLPSSSGIDVFRNTEPYQHK